MFSTTGCPPDISATARRLNLLASSGSALAFPTYADSPTDPGVVCANCHSDGRTWVSTTTPPAPAPSPVEAEVDLQATFDEATGIMTVPAVLVGGQVWSVKLSLDPAKPDHFVLISDSLELNTAVDLENVDPSVLATFNDKKGKFKIPAVLVGDELQDLKLKLVGFIPGPTFVAKEVRHHGGDANEDELGEGNGQQNEDDLDED